MLLTLLFASKSVNGLQSDGCGQPIPDSPENGFSSRFYVQVQDPNMGTVQREYVLHLPEHYETSNEKEVSLILDYHGWSGTAEMQEFKGSLNDVADEQEDETFIIVHMEGGGYDDYGDKVSGAGGGGSWNCTRTDGPYGPPCPIPRPEGHDFTCYKSCEACDGHNSCDVTHCYDDIEFTKAVIKDVTDKYCINLDSIHMTGYSNGGYFGYYAVSQLDNIIASFAPVSASPMLGFNNIPDNPIPVIDFHGTNDPTIPYDLNSKWSAGIGPYLTVLARDFYFYLEKPRVLWDWRTSYECNPEKEAYPTPMDGIDEWTCSKWTNCRNNAEVVHCNGFYGHYYPFANEEYPYIGGTRIIWDFMKNHKRNRNN